MPLKTRMPFRYGIAELTELPHLFLTLEAEIDGERCSGIASDHLPPRWFTKNPEQSPESEISEMLRMARHAAIDSIDDQANSVFNWWLQAYQRQMSWAREEKIPELLAHFGLTLVERALISAFCERHQAPFHSLLCTGKLGFDPSRIYPELAGFEWRSAFPQAPLKRVTLRHTVGLSDPIFERDIAPEQKLNDGLPQSLEANIATYGLLHFKIKLSGNLDHDCDRLESVLQCIERNASSDFRFSLDGNESYPDFNTFRTHWRQLASLPAYQRHSGKLLFVEQPIHRAHALAADNAASLATLSNLPIIIDESDATLDSLPQALEIGYSGTSHKNCKGVFKGLAAKCLLASRQEQRSSSVPPLMQSGEDLSNIGPVALLQDLTVMASLGITSVERNGHQYFAGLSAFSEPLNEAALTELPDLFSKAPQGFAKVQPRGGHLHLEHLLRHPFAPKLYGVLDHAEPLSLGQTQKVC